MQSTPATIDEAAQCVRQHSRVQIVGSGTKSALTQPIDRLARLCTRSLAGVTEYESGEFLVTVLAGTTLESLDAVQEEVERELELELVVATLTHHRLLGV